MKTAVAKSVAFGVVNGLLALGVERHNPVPASAVRETGPLDARLRLSERYLLSKSQIIPKDSGWGADQYARWIEAIALTGEYTGTRSPEFDRVVKEFLNLQQDDGGFLMAQMRRQEWWGATRALVALVNTYDATGDQNLLKAATRLGDYIIAKAPLAPQVDLIIHAHYHSALEGLVRLNALTGEQRYLDFAASIARITDPEVDTPGPIKLAHRPITSLVRGWKPHQHHTHSYLETVQGIVDLYGKTGDPRYFELADGAWRQTLRHTMWVSGGIPEVYGEFFEHNDETCPVVSWILLGLKLYRETGDGSYLDVVERSALNHLMFNQDHAGGFYADRSICPRERVAPGNQGSVADACCSPWGAKGLYELIRHIYSTAPGTVDVNFYFPSTLETDLPGSGANIKLKLETSYPERGDIRLTVVRAPASPATIRIRVPRFASKPVIRIDGRRQMVSVDRGFASIERQWRDGEKVDINFELKLRLVAAGRNGFEPDQPSALPDYLDDGALLWGPLVLMIDRQYNNAKQPAAFTVTIAKDKNGNLLLPKEPSSAARRTLFAWPSAHFRAPLSADATADSSSTVVLIPMAEITGFDRLWHEQYKVRSRIFVVADH